MALGTLHGPLSIDKVQQLITYFSFQLRIHAQDPSENSIALQPFISHVYGNLSFSLNLFHPFVPQDAWIIDTGSTHHVYYNISLFSHLTITSKTIVTLPNWRPTNVNRIGIVKLSESLVLNNVLFVPLFYFNLISVSALTLSHHCCINFLSTLCLIQDLT